ncbi:cytochrome P450 CYP72A616-like [Magnolia sinica]|uniref:cytochrome P450 CYP72A616-like n=1 Tax=Magnolia sinica TaxID=86752 RepID=UPI002659848A|nr:cytochrome P450 CYP72A616-like [Magnolia sinica]
MEEILSIFLIISASLLLSCGVRVVYFIWWRPMKLQKHLNQQGIKGNSYKLFFGDMKEMGRLMKEAWSKPMNLTHWIAPRVFPYFYHLVQKEGKLSLIWVGTTPRLIINDSELMMQVLSNKFGHFQKVPLNPLVNLLTLGLTALEGEEWVKRRRIITPAFHLEKLKAMIPAFSTSCSELIQRWGELVGPEGSCELDVWPELQNLTGDVISRTAFGSNYEEGKRIFELQKEQVVLVLEAAFAPYIPGLRFVPTKKNRRRMYLDKEIKAILRNLIHKKEQAMKMGESSTNDLLGLLLLQSNNCNGVLEPGTNSENNALTIDDVIEECKLFYFAGQETTSVWLTWTMILLAMYPSWQERAREEVLQICGKNTPDFDGTSHFKIVTMILYEVLRLYPSVAAIFRHTYKKVDLGGISIPQGVDLMLPTLLIHHDPELWGEDHEEFKPERFSGGVSKASKDQTAFFPFGWGPRICIGQNFAMIEARMALAMILQNFSFSLSPSYTHAPYTLISLQPQYGAQVILHRI